MGLGSVFGLGPPRKKEAAVKISDIIETLAPGVAKKEGAVAARSQAAATLEKARKGFDWAKQGNAPSALLLKTILSAVVTHATAIKICSDDRSTLKGTLFTFDAAKDSLEQLKSTPATVYRDDIPVPARPANKEIDISLNALEKVEALFKDLSKKFPPGAAPAVKAEDHARLDL